jgi:hypothetical protein
VHLYFREKPVDILYGNISDLMNRTKTTDTLCGRNLILQQVEFANDLSLFYLCLQPIAGHKGKLNSEF